MKSEGSHHYFLPHTKVTKGVGDTVTPTMRRVRLMKYAYMNRTPWYETGVNVLNAIGVKKT